MPSKRSKSKQPPSKTVIPFIRINRRHSRLLSVIFVALFVVLGSYVVYASLASGSTELKSGIGNNYCLDDHGDGGPGTQVDTYPCNGSAAQHFSDSGGVIHLGAACIYPSGAGSKTRGRYIVEISCSPTPWGGVWTESGGRFLNNHADSFGGSYCLDVSGSVAGGSVDIWPCNGGANQAWTSTTYSSGGGGGGGGGSGYNCSVPGYGSPSATYCGYLANAVIAENFSSNTQAQMTCTSNIYWRESSWSNTVWNGGSHLPTGSGAFGIAQSLPYSKYPKLGWPTGYGGKADANTQIAWGVAYMTDTYGSPCGAWSYWQVHHNYVQVK
jgi:hypothetical protein